MYTLKLSITYRENKGKFLSQHNNNPMLVTAVRQLERSILDYQHQIENPSINGFPWYANTPFQVNMYKILAVYSVANINTMEIAPCVLFFALETTVAKIRATIYPAVQAVLTELNW